jgi:hypothetical protein
MSGRNAWRVLALATALLLAVGSCANGPGSGSGSAVSTIGAPPPSSVPLGSPTLASVRADVESRYRDQLLSIGNGADKVVLQLKPTATAAASEIVGRYGWAVQVSVGFFPYPPPSSTPSVCGWAPSQTVDRGPLRAVIELPSPRIGHTVALSAKVKLTNSGSTTFKVDTGQPLSIYLFAANGTLVGASPGAVAGTGLGLKLLPGASQEIEAAGGTASCDLHLGYELPDGPYVARAAVEIDGSTGPGYFWSDPISVDLAAT